MTDSHKTESEREPISKIIKSGDTTIDKYIDRKLLDIGK